MSTVSLEQLVSMAPSIATQSPHPDVSDKYCHIRTIDLIAPMMEAGWQPVRARQAPVLASARQGFQRHQIFFRREQDAKLGNHRPEEHYFFKKGEVPDVFELSIINSHDRTTAWQFNAGIFRPICSNGLMVSRGLFMGQRIKHINISPREVTLAAIQATHSIETVMAHRDLMTRRILTDDERLNFAERGLALKYEVPAMQSPIEPRDLLSTRREEDRGLDLWSTFNVVQENLVKGLQAATRVDPNGRKYAQTNPIVKLDRQVWLNQELWGAAEELLAAKN